MNAREIEIFCTIIRCKTLSAAAAQLHVTQPALSKALRHCEDRLGYKLFHRTGGRLRPTAEANVLIGSADEIYRKIRSFSLFSAEVGGHAAGILRIGATSSLASSIVPQAIVALRKQSPGVHVVLQMLAVPELEEALASRRVDIGVSLSPLLAPVSESREIAQVPCVALLRRAEPISQQSSLALADLQHLPEVGFGTGQDFGRSIVAAFHAANLERSLQIEVGTTTSALAVVRAGGGYAIVDGLTSEYLPADMIALPIEPRIARPLMVVRSPGSGTPALAERFELLLQQIAETAVSRL